jgi:serine/threonine-protein kinase RsbW
MTGWVSQAGAASPLLWLLPSEPKSVGVVRQRLTALVARLPTSRLDDVLLTASEVVTNAVLHGDGPVVCRVWLGVNVVRMEVADDGEGVPRLRGDPVDDGEGGRGLRIVDVLASRWGVTPKRPGPGKTVWFELGRADSDPPGEEG